MLTTSNPEKSIRTGNVPSLTYKKKRVGSPEVMPKTLTMLITLYPLTMAIVVILSVVYVRGRSH